MKRLIILLMVCFLMAELGSAEGKKNYHLGTFVSAHSVTDGTITSTYTAMAQPLRAVCTRIT